MKISKSTFKVTFVTSTAAKIQGGSLWSHPSNANKSKMTLAAQRLPNVYIVYIVTF